MKVFTIKSGEVSEGAFVEKLLIKGGKVAIPAVIIGETGHNRKRGVVPVQLTYGQHRRWSNSGQVKILFADVCESKQRNPKFIARDEVGCEKSAICIFRTEPDSQSGPNYTGDRIGEEEYIEHGTVRTRLKFDDFPGEILASGVTANVNTEGVTFGKQYIVKMPKNSVFRTSNSGCPDGDESVYYYFWNGWELIGGLSWNDRCDSDEF